MGCNFIVVNQLEFLPGLAQCGTPAHWLRKQPGTPFSPNPPCTCKYLEIILHKVFMVHQLKFAKFFIMRYISRKSSNPI